MNQEIMDLNDKLHFRDLAKYYVQSFNPRLRHEVIILDAIWCYDYKRIKDMPTRYDAHDFVKYINIIVEDIKLNPSKTYTDTAETLVSNSAIPLHRIDMVRWIGEWLTNYA